MSKPFPTVGLAPTSDATLIPSVGGLSRAEVLALLKGNPALFGNVVGDNCRTLSDYERAAHAYWDAQDRAGRAMRHYDAGANPFAEDVAEQRHECERFGEWLAQLVNVVVPMFAGRPSPLTVIGLNGRPLHEDRSTDWAAFRRDLSSILAAVAISPPTVAPTACATPDVAADNGALSDTQQNVLTVLKERGATDPNRRVTAEDIATAASGGDWNAYKKPLAELVERQFILSKAGRGGGYWLTAPGIKLADTLPPIGAHTSATIAPPI